MPEEKDKQKEWDKETQRTPKVEHGAKSQTTNVGGETFNENAGNEQDPASKQSFKGHGPDPSRMKGDTPDPEKNLGGLTRTDARPGANTGGSVFRHWNNNEWLAEKEELEKSAQTNEIVEGQLPHRIGNEQTYSELVKANLDLVKTANQAEEFFNELKLDDKQKEKSKEILATLRG